MAIPAVPIMLFLIKSLLSVIYSFYKLYSILCMLKLSPSSIFFPHCHGKAVPKPPMAGRVHNTATIPGRSYARLHFPEVSTNSGTYLCPFPYRYRTIPDQQTGSKILKKHGVGGQPHNHGRKCPGINWNAYPITH